MTLSGHGFKQLRRGGPQRCTPPRWPAPLTRRRCVRKICRNRVRWPDIAVARPLGLSLPRASASGGVSDRTSDRESAQQRRLLVPATRRLMVGSGAAQSSATRPPSLHRRFAVPAGAVHEGRLGRPGVESTHRCPNLSQRVTSARRAGRLESARSTRGGRSWRRTSSRAACAQAGRAAPLVAALGRLAPTDGVGLPQERQGAIGRHVARRDLGHGCEIGIPEAAGHPTGPRAAACGRAAQRRSSCATKWPDRTPGRHSRTCPSRAARAAHRSRGLPGRHVAVDRRGWGRIERGTATHSSGAAAPTMSAVPASRVAGCRTEPASRRRASARSWAAPERRHAMQVRRQRRGVSQQLRFAPVDDLAQDPPPLPSRRRARAPVGDSGSANTGR